VLAAHHFRTESRECDSRTAPTTTSAASSRSHSVRQLGMLAAAPPPGVGTKRSARQPAGGARSTGALCAPQERGEGRALPAPHPTRRRERAAARAARRDGAEGAALARRAAAADAWPRRCGLRRSRSQRPNRRSGTPVDLPAAAAGGPTALLGGRAALMQPAGGRASAARRAAPLLPSASRCGPCWEPAADNVRPGARRWGVSRCPHLTPLTAGRSEVRGDAAGALLRPWRRSATADDLSATLVVNRLILQLIGKRPKWTWVYFEFFLSPTRFFFSLSFVRKN